MTDEPHITITLADVVRFGGVSAAIVGKCRATKHLASGVYGHGGTSLQSAIQAFEDIPYLWTYIDEDDGHPVEKVELSFRNHDTDGGPNRWWIAEDEPDSMEIEYDGPVYRDPKGRPFAVREKDGYSEVCLDCPSPEEADQHPEAAAEMAAEAICPHCEYSDHLAWHTLCVGAEGRFAECLEEESVDPSDFTCPEKLESGMMKPTPPPSSSAILEKLLADIRTLVDRACEKVDERDVYRVLRDEAENWDELDPDDYVMDPDEDDEDEDEDYDE